MTESETIAAVATASGKSALAMIRVSGSSAFEITGKCIQEKCLFERTKPRLVTLYSAQDPERNKTIDQITAVKYPGPHSFTGENMVEVVCHGGPVIVREMMDALLSAGARQAGPGEFTRRALLNGKIDTLKAEAIRGLIESTSEAQLVCAQKLYEGKPSALEMWRDDLVELLSRIEANIEFGEDDHTFSDIEKEKNKIEAFIDKIENDLEKRKKIRELENGLRVVIAGPANSGKSTLFNIITGHDRAIVHSEPGTTRDIVSERILIHGHEIQLIDSAGIRETESDVEREGIKRSREAIVKANLILWITAADESFTKQELQELVTIQNTKNICVITKIDKCNGEKKARAIRDEKIETVLASLTERTNINILMEKIRSAVEQVSKEIEIPDIFFNDRHEEIGRALKGGLILAREEWGAHEKAAYHLKKVLSKTNEYFGTNHSEEVLNRIFENFCIGK